MLEHVDCVNPALHSVSFRSSRVTRAATGNDYVRHDFPNIPPGLRIHAGNGAVEMALRRAVKDAGATVDR